MRQHLGSSASAALPLLWKKKIERNQSSADVARALEIDDAMAAKLLYGDRRAGRDLSLRCLMVYGVPIEAWGQPCPKGWRPVQSRRAA